MQAGKLRHQITIERPVESIVGGESRETWSMVATTWAEIVPLAGREFRTAAEPRADMTHTLRIRYREGLDSRCRIRLGDRVLNLIAPPKDIDERHAWIEMACREEE